MVWVDLDAAGCTVERFVQVAAKCGVRASGGRLVVHYREFFVGFVSSFLLGGGSGCGGERAEGSWVRCGVFGEGVGGREGWEGGERGIGAGEGGGGGSAQELF